MSEEVPKGETSCCGCKYEHDDSCNIGKLCRAGEESLQAENKRLKEKLDIVLVDNEDIRAKATKLVHVVEKSFPCPPQPKE